ncbi:hypothetical protein K490DRAFT_43669 [Saccharata proteae CBS 121410]|uniref:Histone chaperone domain-containing protein n=1 Tax=Saccharata proteae CBS 121410 TaxID=1314787 RepID=A0A9P4HTS3_9PEZI|nr:hypothetical protein K490DRAFT_43669 [Saccharata proteae CBS 121410]
MYEQQNDQTGGDIPTGDKGDNSYTSRSGQYQIPVQKDEAPVNDPIDARTADSDEQLARDEQEAIDSDNVISSRTRGATKQAGTYAEPGDEEGLPENDGTSAIRQ